MCTKIVTSSLNEPPFQKLLTIKNNRYFATYEGITSNNNTNNGVDTATISSKPNSTMQARILRKAWNTNKDFKRSTLKMWSTHLRGVQFTRTQLELYQKKLMNKIKIEGTMSNTITLHGINQWYFHNNKYDTNSHTITDKGHPQNAIKLPVLLVHGYASSSMSFYRNIPYLSRNCKDLYAIDLPSNGLSDQPKLNITPIDPSIFGQYMEVNNGKQIKVVKLPNREKCRCFIKANIDYYIDAIEKWRLDNNIEKFHLVGHSFGGYLSFQYSLKYPTSFHKLCLISTLGVEKNKICY